MAGKKEKVKKFFKGFIVLLLLLALIIGGFALGIYLRIFNTQDANEKFGLYNLPVIGRYFVKPAPKESPIEEDTSSGENPAAQEDQQKQKQKKISQKDIEKQQKEREAAERKRVSKLARLYNNMKPQDAASAMDTLDDDLCVAILQRMDEGQAAKILSAFQPSKAGRLTQLMYEGTKKQMMPTSGADGQQPGSGADGQNG
ncbi:MAG: magnesium transporter MgtE [Selenomonadaceae bacterium]|nr:magnesium transporter MgtE [Selenomonadaceae bacterium]MDY2685483.1 magnesium transporter MgtE [Selenomonadaceae bacterium]